MHEKLKSFNAAINHVTEFSKDRCAFPGDIRSSEPELRVQDIIIRTISLLFLFIVVRDKVFYFKSTKLRNEKCLIEQP